MKKDIARREFLKLKLDGCSYAACQKELFQRHNFTASFGKMTWSTSAGATIATGLIEASMA